MIKPRVYIVGAGITGCSLSYFLRDTYEVILYEKSNEIGGLLKTQSNIEGLKYQQGSQILHTNEEWIVNLFQKYIPMKEVNYSVGIDPLFDFRYYDFPFTKSAIECLPWHWSEAIIADLESVRGHTAPNIAKLIENFYGETAYTIFYQNLFRKFFLKDPFHIKDVKWIKKQYLRPIEDTSKYYRDEYVVFPTNVGYNDLFSELTEGTNVEVNKTMTYEDVPKDGTIVLTSRPDKFFGMNAELEYVHVEFDIDSAIYNSNKPDKMFYPNYTPFICINQFGKFFNQKDKNIVSKVYHSLSDGKPAYPVHTSKNMDTHKKLHEAYSNNVHFLGPHAEYKVMSIGECVSSAAQLAASLKIKGDKKNAKRN